MDKRTIFLLNHKAHDGLHKVDRKGLCFFYYPQKFQGNSNHVPFHGRDWWYSRKKSAEAASATIKAMGCSPHWLRFIRSWFSGAFLARYRSQVRKIGVGPQKQIRGIWFLFNVPKAPVEWVGQRGQKKNWVIEVHAVFSLKITRLRKITLFTKTLIADDFFNTKAHEVAQKTERFWFFLIRRGFKGILNNVLSTWPRWWLTRGWKALKRRPKKLGCRSQGIIKIHVVPVCPIWISNGGKGVRPKITGFF